MSRVPTEQYRTLLSLALVSRCNLVRDIRGTPEESRRLARLPR